MATRRTGWPPGVDSPWGKCLGACGSRYFQNIADLNRDYLYSGTGHFDAIPAPEEAFGEGTSKFGLWTLDANASLPFQALGHSFQYNAAPHVQDNSTPLIAQDRYPSQRAFAQHRPLPASA